MRRNQVQTGRTSFWAALITMITLAPGLQGQPLPPTRLRLAEETPGTPPRQEPIARGPLGLLAHASALIGQTVRDRDAKPVGELRDLVLSMADGKVLGGLISRGDGTLVLAPSECFFPASDNRIVLNKGKASVQAAPRLATVASQVDPDYLDAAFRHFGIATPEWTKGAARSTPPKACWVEPS